MCVFTDTIVPHKMLLVNLVIIRAKFVEGQTQQIVSIVTQQHIEPSTEVNVYVMMDTMMEVFLKFV